MIFTATLAFGLTLAPGLLSLPARAEQPPVIYPAKPTPRWSWDRIPTSFHGADKERARTAVFATENAVPWLTAARCRCPRRCRQAALVRRAARAVASSSGVDRCLRRARGLRSWRSAGCKILLSDQNSAAS